MKIKTKCTDANKVATIINNAYALYRTRPVYNVIITRDNNTSFSLRGTEENKQRFIDTFIDCIVDYAVSHGILITGRVVRDTIYFEDLKKEESNDNTSAS